MELLERIGSGGYGEVWLCRNALGALRAVKIVRCAEFDDNRPYEREFKGIRSFEPISRTHEGFVDILQVGRNEAEGWFYYVMELADPMDADSGQYQPRTLASELKRRGALPFDECIQLALSLARGLSELHRHDLVHRDIKPSNIIFVNSAPKLADVGLVTSAADSRSFVGTEGFIPPEGPGTPQADIYSLGIVLYVIATGKHHRDFPEPPADLATRSDRDQVLEVTAIIHKATQTNPRHRYQTAESLLADLQRLDAGNSIKLRHAMLRKLSWGSKAALAISLIAAGAFVIRHERTLRKASLEWDETPSFERSGSTNFQSWEAMLRARTLLNTFMARGLSNSIVEYERALALDPNFASAWSGLAGAHLLLMDKGFAHGSNHVERARFCARRAVELNPASGSALHWLAMATLAADYDFRRAEPIYREAIERTPKLAVLRHNYAFVLWFYGRFDEAEAILRGVLRDQPSFGYTHSVLGQIACSRGDYKSALRELDECLLLVPAGPDPFLERFVILWLMGRKTEAVRDLLRCMELDGFSAVSREDSLLLGSRSRNETPDQALSAVVELLERRRGEGQFVSAFDLARFYALLGDKTRALDRLEQAVEEHRPFTLSVKVQPALKFLNGDVRYHQSLRRLKLED